MRNALFVVFVQPTLIEDTGPKFTHTLASATPGPVVTHPTVAGIACTVLVLMHIACTLRRTSATRELLYISTMVVLRLAL